MGERDQTNKLLKDLIALVKSGKGLGGESTRPSRSPEPAGAPVEGDELEVQSTKSRARLADEEASRKIHENIAELKRDQN